MAEAIKNRWLLFLVLVVFIIVKIPALHYPFYWDESWSYAPGVKLMYLHGPSLMPNAIDLGYSRGHPLLFYATAAAWMKVFGSSHIAQHCFSLCISLLLLITVYEAGLRLFSKRIAITALLLVALQVIFFVQSTLLLPEIMVAWLSLLTIYCYAHRRYIGTAISCTALLLTKESGLTLGLVLGLHAAWHLFSKADSRSEKWKNFVSVAIPGIIIGAFFLLQKKLNGWYLYPEHTGLIDLSWQMFKGKLRYCIEIIFAHQYRSYLFGLLMALSAATAIYKRNIRYAYPALLGILLFIVGGEYYGIITRRLLLPAVFVAYLYTFHSLIKLDNTGKPAQRFIYLCLLFTGAYLSFTSLNFFTNRYLLSALIIFLFLAAYCFNILLQHFKPAFFYSFIAIIFIIAAFAFSNSTGIGDVDMGIYGAMKVQEDVVTYLEQQQLQQQPIAAPSSLQRAHLTLPYTGFLHTPAIFTNVNYTIAPNTQYLILDNIEPDTLIDRTLLRTTFRQIYRTTHDSAWAEIYKRQ